MYEMPSANRPGVLVAVSTCYDVGVGRHRRDHVDVERVLVALVLGVAIGSRLAPPTCSDVYVGSAVGRGRTDCRSSSSRRCRSATGPIAGAEDHDGLALAGLRDAASCCTASRDWWRRTAATAAAGRRQLHHVRQPRQPALEADDAARPTARRRATASASSTAAKKRPSPSSNWCRLDAERPLDVVGGAAAADVVRPGVARVTKPCARSHVARRAYPPAEMANSSAKSSGDIMSLVNRCSSRNLLSSGRSSRAARARSRAAHREVRSQDRLHTRRDRSVRR